VQLCGAATPLICCPALLSTPLSLLPCPVVEIIQALQPDIDVQLCQVMLHMRKKLDLAAARANKQFGKNYGQQE